MQSVGNIALAEELRRRGIRPSRKLGQNFMIDRAMLDFIVKASGVDAGDIVLEVGTGAGFLTERLCQKALWVVSVEIDRGLYELSLERLAPFPNLTLVHADALGASHRWGADVVQAVAAARERASGAALRLVANLPYSAATPIVQAVLEGEGATEFAGALFTCQKEVAGRLLAGPGTDAFGYISVLSALLADRKLVKTLGPGVFWPKPKVDSAIVEITPSAEKRALAGDLQNLRRVVSVLLTQRRKRLITVMKAADIDDYDIIRVGERLSLMGIPLEERVFRLPVEAFRDIAGAVSMRPDSR